MLDMRQVYLSNKNHKVLGRSLDFQMYLASMGSVRRWSYARTENPARKNERCIRLASAGQVIIECEDV
jgi:hypothetical protein